MADLQTTNRVSLAKIRESTFGVTPTSPAFKAIRQTSSGLSANPKTVITSEIRSDRQVVDAILVGQDAGGDVGGELAFAVADDDFEEALQGTWSSNPVITVATIDTEISDVAATTLTVSAGGAAFVAGALTFMSNFTTAANNKLARVVSSTATSIVYAAATFTAEAAQIPVGATVRVVGFQAGTAADIVAVTAGGNALTSTTADFTTYGISVGEWVKVGDSDTAGFAFATTANNGFCRVSAVTAHRLSFDRVPTGWTADSAAGIALRVFIGDFLTNSSTKRSNTIERQYLDHSPVTYEYLTGMTLNTFKIDAKPQAIATYTKNYMGKYASVTTTRVSGATDVAAPTNFVLNTSSNVGRIGFDGSTITGPNFVLGASISINNNLRAQKAIGSIGSVGTGNGEFTVSGTLDTYFGDKTILDKVFNNTLTSFDLRLGRTDGNREAIIVDLPSIKLGSGSPSVSGKNTDVTLSSAFTAIRDATLLYTVSVSRYFYLPIV